MTTSFAASLPWGLEIDPRFGPEEFGTASTYHPTCLYEALWNLGLVLMLVRAGRSRRLAQGNLLWLYAAGPGASQPKGWDRARRS